MNIKLQKIKKEGLGNLQIVLDFDRTITAHSEAGKQAPSLVHFLRLSQILGEEYHLQANANFNYYFPYENDHTMNEREQEKMMEEWWKKHLDLVVYHGLTLAQIKEIAESSELILREGLKELFDFAKERKIPIIIFSANVLGKESIEFFLKRFGIDLENIHIVTNELHFNEEGKSFRFSDKVVHSKNKDENLISENLKRKNTILAGDGLGDAQMVVDEEGGIVYRIAVLDEIPEEKLGAYRKLFDDIISPATTLNFRELVFFLNFPVDKEIVGIK
jgi:HAD superfamily hydrolase (TIGR01544 family)